jgi:hypothetical protein
MDGFIQVIQTVGFPIACAVAMFLMLQGEQKSHREETEKLTETINTLRLDFAESMNSQQKNVTEAINNNTLVIQKLIDKLDGETK